MDMCREWYLPVFYTNSKQIKKKKKNRQILKHTADRYSGVIVNASDLPHDVSVFKSCLALSLESWFKKKKKTFF